MQAILQLHLSDQQFYRLLSCISYLKFDGKNIAIIDYLHVHFFVR